MNNQQAYNTWANNYDTVINKTRDIEALAIRTTLAKYQFRTVLEIGCGTGKNTEWLAANSTQVTAADFSEEMLNKAKEKLTQHNVQFIQTNITEEWKFEHNNFDLITCSLILEHINNIDFVFMQASLALKPGGLFYIGELHPFKQYQGSKARFETAGETMVLECFIHNVSDYFNAATQNNFECLSINEWFDDDNQKDIPRLLSLVFKKK